MTLVNPNDNLLAFADFALAQSGSTSDSVESSNVIEISDDESDSLDSSTEASCTDETCCPPLTKPNLVPTVPPEILLQILSHALTTALAAPYIIDNQFGHLTTHCRPCVYRALCLVSREFYAIAHELFVAQIVLDRREAGTRDDSRLVERVGERGWGGWVRSVDASLRGSNSGGVPERARDQDALVTHVDAGEKEREKQSERDRCTLLQCLQLTPQLQSLDVDLGFHAGVLREGAVPTSLRSLTLRNADAEDTFNLISRLPHLAHLTLRPVLDFYLPETSPLHGTAALNSFELSITGWGETDTFTINRLLSSSSESLKHLTLRNKGAVSIPSFLPVSRELIARYGAQLHSLAVKDVPHHGIRPPQETPLTTFFPVKAPLMSQLKKLHLTGMPYSPAFLTAILGQGSHLRELTIEDFDEQNGDAFLSCLAVPALKGIKTLRVTHCGTWGEEEVIEAWARERGVELKAGWRMRQVTRRWW